MTASAFAVLQLVAFVLAAAPLVIEGINDWTASNRSNAILFGGGVVTALAALALGHATFSVGDLALGVVIAAGIVGVAATGALSGGVAKSCIALLPWFGIGTWLAVFSAGMLLAGLIGLAMKRDVLVAPPLVASGAVALALPLLG